MTIYYKWLDAEGKSPHAEWQWPLPTQNADGTWRPGEWTPMVEDLEECKSGYHGCYDTIESLLEYCCAGTLWQLEYDGEIAEHSNKANGRRARLLRPMGSMTKAQLRLLACDYAEHVQRYWTEQYPSDNRPQECIDTVRAYVRGEASWDEVVAARDAAWAARDARAAAWAAAWAAARDAAWGAARDAAWAAAWGAEHDWQKERLFAYLRGEA